jgi:Haem-binding domain/Cytochrome P460
MRFIWRLAGLGFVVFLLMQCVRPSLTNPPVTADLQAPPEVKAILKKSCYSCHSNETALPWFDQIAPGHWLVVHDVKAARAKLNFSEIGKLPVAAQRAALYEAVNMVQFGAMPLPSYRHVHPESTVTSEGLQVLRTYLDPFAAPPAVDETLTATSDGQFKRWAGMSTPARKVDPEWNGVEFYPDYKNWKVISTTDRRDNKTIRVITGNDVAIKAIEDKQVHPWPDGAVLAKIAWQTVPDDQGMLRAGPFVQVEFMVKDKTKYASTEGWGFGRWRGMDLKPYGKDAEFVTECTGCHRPLKANDYLYTMPIERKGN